MFPKVMCWLKGNRERSRRFVLPNSTPAPLGSSTKVMFLESLTMEDQSVDVSRLANESEAHQMIGMIRFVSLATSLTTVSVTSLWYLVNMG